MHDPYQLLRLRVLRRVTYATNAAALRSDLLPPDAPFDAALTNGLLVIVAEDSPGEENLPNGRTRSAAALLKTLASTGTQYPYLQIGVLDDGIRRTQLFRHGRAIEEDNRIRREHVAALLLLDQHPALDFIDAVTIGTTFGDLTRRAFEEAANQVLPGGKRRLDVPGVEDCEECWRPTFLPSGWDDNGGTLTEGVCIACGYQRSAEDAEEAAFSTYLRHNIDGF